MIRLVVSTRNVGEANLARECGADLIDLKEPALGSLGAVDKSVAKNVCAALSHHKLPLSMALGELGELDIAQDFGFLQGFQYVKVGLANCHSAVPHSSAVPRSSTAPHSSAGAEASDQSWMNRLQLLQQNLPLGTELVAVFYVDRASCNAPEFESILHFAFLRDLPAMLFDTYDKTAGNLFDYCAPRQVSEHCYRCECAGLKTVLAGSVGRQHLSEVKKINPDYVAVRGAVCKGNRAGKLDQKLLKEFASELKRPAAPARAETATSKAIPV